MNNKIYEDLTKLHSKYCEPPRSHYIPYDTFEGALARKSAKNQNIINAFKRRSGILNIMNHDYNEGIIERKERKNQTFRVTGRCRVMTSRGTQT